MRVSVVGLFLVVGLITVGCKKSDDAPPDSQAIGADNGPALGEGTPQNPTPTTPGVVTPTRVIQPVRPAFAPIGAAPGAGNVPPPPVVAQAAPPASPVPTPPVKAAPTTPASPPAGAGAVAGRGVPPPPGGRPKPGTK
ncbi:MAG: hypothetical protein ABJE95_24155 [Byssovorax sp.]